MSGFARAGPIPAQFYNQKPCQFTLRPNRRKLGNYLQDDRKFTRMPPDKMAKSEEMMKF